METKITLIMLVTGLIIVIAAATIAMRAGPVYASVITCGANPGMEQCKYCTPDTFGCECGPTQADCNRMYPNDVHPG